MDISGTTEPRSDQINFDDVAVKTITVTVESVKSGPPEQPVELHLVEYPGRPYKPGKSMRRVLIACWGAEASEYVGRQLRLYGDPTVKFGGQEVGGIRIAALSHLTEAKSVSLTVTRGKRAPFVVQPLDPEVHVAALSAAANLEALQAAWRAATWAGVTSAAAVVAAKDKRKGELGG